MNKWVYLILCVVVLIAAIVFEAKFQVMAKINSWLMYQVFKDWR